MNAAPLPAFEPVNLVQLVPIDWIETAPQIRTRNGFDEKSIKELSDSIATFGLLQPIVLRRMDDSMPELDRYTVVAGHRRLAACKLAGIKSIPAVMVYNIEPGRHHEMQLVENIQREALSLADTADAVRTLLTLYKKPATVAAIVCKSQSWVSKHLTLTAPSFSDDVRQLLESGATEDLELLVTLNLIAKQPDSGPALSRLVGDVVTNEAGRKEARAVLAKLKGRSQDDDDEDEEEQETGSSSSTRALWLKVPITEQELKAVKTAGGPGWARSLILAGLKAQGIKVSK